MGGRPVDDPARVRALIRDQLGAAVVTLEPLVGGEFSRAYAVAAAGGAYVVRLSAYPHAAESFAKDAYAGRHFASAALPIPCVIALGQTESDHFAISQRVTGRRLAELPAATRPALLPNLLDTLAAIAQADLGSTRGYGDWDAAGQGRSASWREFLAAVIENHHDGFYADWHALFRTSFLERELYQRVYAVMLRLVDACPEERALIHNDFHDDNVLSDGRRVTGVVDWGNALYGDPLYDVAWLDGWFVKEGEPVAATRLRARYQTLPHFDERMRCYACYLGLDDLRFYARTSRRADYERTRARLLALIADEVAQG